MGHPGKPPYGVVFTEKKGDQINELLSWISAHKIQPAQTLGEKALAVARSQIGIKESPSGSNSGPQVTEYQKTTGAYRLPWCASFAKWCYIKAGCASALRSHMTADVTTWLSYLHVNATDVRPGDLVIYNWNGGDVDHIGLFEKWISGHNTFSDIEGNTSETSQNNGGEVMRRSRSMNSTVAAFVRVK
jgi:hypothetical protein